jgi:hypothetical protein
MHIKDRWKVWRHVASLGWNVFASRSVNRWSCRLINGGKFFSIILDTEYGCYTMLLPLLILLYFLESVISLRWSDLCFIYRSWSQCSNRSKYCTTELQTIFRSQFAEIFRIHINTFHILIWKQQMLNTDIRRITTFRSPMDRIYECCPIRLCYNIIL